MSELLPEEKLEIFALAEDGQNRLRKVVQAHGFNIGLNLGSCAGAGVPDHLHMHIVPRWTDDTNFMPVFTGTRVITEGFRDLYQKLVKA